MIKFIDLFSGMGGMKLGFEQASKELNSRSHCLLMSDIKKSSISVLKENYPDIQLLNNIKDIDEKKLSDFDFLIGGFPCQAFSQAGRRKGFEDTRGTLFFEIARIIKEKQPQAFLLENVEGLITHNKKNKNDKIGDTLETILSVLKELGYEVSYKVLNGEDFGVPQKRKRIFIVGSKCIKFDFSKIDELPKVKNKDILIYGQPTINSEFTKLLIDMVGLKNLDGKSITDKRGGKDNIHSWDFNLKGEIDVINKNILCSLLKERRRKKWAELKGLTWMDGFPLTYEEISTFIKEQDLRERLEKLHQMGYLKKEHPKELIILENGVKIRVPQTQLDMGYNIRNWSLALPIKKILKTNGVCQTLVATDMDRFYVLDYKSEGLRQLSEIEALRMFGFPDDYKIATVSKNELFDLLGNSVIVPIIKEISKEIIKQLFINK